MLCTLCLCGYNSCRYCDYTTFSHRFSFLFKISPIFWLSQWQNIFETSTFGSEYVTLWIWRDLTKSLRNELRMFGIPIKGPAQVFCDNKGVVKNIRIPESILLKKPFAINYLHSPWSSCHKNSTSIWRRFKANLAELFARVWPVPYTHN